MSNSYRKGDCRTTRSAVDFTTPETKYNKYLIPEHRNIPVCSWCVANLYIYGLALLSKIFPINRTMLPREASLSASNVLKRRLFEKSEPGCGLSILFLYQLFYSTNRPKRDE